MHTTSIWIAVICTLPHVLHALYMPQFYLPEGETDPGPPAYTLDVGCRNGSGSQAVVYNTSACLEGEIPIITGAALVQKLDSESCLWKEGGCKGQVNSSAILNDFFKPKGIRNLLLQDDDLCFKNESRCSPEQLASYSDIKSWLRGADCKKSNHPWATALGPDTLGCCEVCQITGGKVDVYYWPDPEADTSCLSIVGSDIPIDYGATKDFLTWWGCVTPLSDGSPRTNMIAALNTDNTLAGNYPVKSYFENPQNTSGILALCPDFYEKFAGPATSSKALSHNGTTRASGALRANPSTLTIASNARWQNGTLVSTAVVDGYTFTSPSIYARFSNVKGEDGCGTSLISSTMLSFDPGELSTFETGPGHETTKSFNFKDMPCPPKDVASRHFWIPTPGDPYRPFIALPKKIADINDWWQTCDRYFSAYDPPRTLEAGLANVPQATMALDVPVPNLDQKPAAPASKADPGLPAQTAALQAAPNLVPDPLESQKPDPKPEPVVEPQSKPENPPASKPKPAQQDQAPADPHSNKAPQKSNPPGTPINYQQNKDPVPDNKPAKSQQQPQPAGDPAVHETGKSSPVQPVDNDVDNILPANPPQKPPKPVNKPVNKPQVEDPSAPSGPTENRPSNSEPQNPPVQQAKNPPAKNPNPSPAGPKHQSSYVAPENPPQHASNPPSDPPNDSSNDSHNDPPSDSHNNPPINPPGGNTQPPSNSKEESPDQHQPQNQPSEPGTPNQSSQPSQPHQVPGAQEQSSGEDSSNFVQPPQNSNPSPKPQKAPQEQGNTKTAGVGSHVFAPFDRLFGSDESSSSPSPPPPKQPGSTSEDQSDPQQPGPKPGNGQKPPSASSVHFDLLDPAPPAQPIDPDASVIQPGTGTAGAPAPSDDLGSSGQDQIVPGSPVTKQIKAGATSGPEVLAGQSIAVGHGFSIGLASGVSIPGTKILPIESVIVAGDSSENVVPGVTISGTAVAPAQSVVVAGNSVVKLLPGLMPTPGNGGATDGGSGATAGAGLPNSIGGAVQSDAIPGSPSNGAIYKSSSPSAGAGTVTTGTGSTASGGLPLSSTAIFTSDSRLLGSYSISRLKISVWTICGLIIAL